VLLQLVEPGMTPTPHEENETIAVGIDLGTTHSVIALSMGEKATAIHIDGSALVPSAVAFKDDKTLLVGVEALIAYNPVLSFKRHMNQPAVKLIHDRSPVEYSAEVLRYLKQQAEIAIGHAIQKAVITVPAYFDDTARQATKDAATLAGLTVLRLINEPTAAALSYGLDKGIEGIYAIYDLGGGTFDVSLLKMSMGVFQVLATSGDLHLGGDDIDQAILEYWHNKGLTERTDQEAALLARQAKEALSESQEWTGQLGGQNLSLNQSLLDDLAKLFVEKTLSICERVLSDANLKVTDIQGVVLVGGSTRLRAVKDNVRQFFGKEPLVDLDPDQVVALGAALQAEALTQGSNTLLLDVTPLSLGIETMGGLVEKIIPRNTPIPSAMAQEFTTYQDGQMAIKIHVVQGERELVEDCRSLGEFILSGIPPMMAGAARIQVTFTVDADGLLTVSAQEKMTGTVQTISVKPSYGLESKDFEKMLLEGLKEGTKDLEDRLLIESRMEARQIITYLKTALDQDRDLLKEKEEQELKKGIDTLQEVIEGSDRAEIKTQTKVLSALSQPFAERRINRSIQKRLLGQTILQKD
jgi:molecular chaperone HscA